MSKWIITEGPSLSDYRDENHVPNKDRVSYSKSTGKEYNDATELLEDMLNMDELKTAYRLRMYLDRASNDFKYWRVTFCFDCLNEIGRKSNSTSNRNYTATFELIAKPTAKELSDYDDVPLNMIDEELQDATGGDVGLDYEWEDYDIKLKDLVESRLRRGRMLKESFGFDWEHGNFDVYDLIKFLEKRTGVTFKKYNSRHQNNEGVFERFFETTVPDVGDVTIIRYEDENDSVLEVYVDGTYVDGIDPTGDEDADPHFEEERNEFLERLVNLLQGKTF